MIPAKKLLELALSREATDVVIDYDTEDLFETAEEAWAFLLEVEEGWVSFRRYGETIGEALLMVPGPNSCDDDESIADYGINPWMTALVKEAENDGTEIHQS